MLPGGRRNIRYKPVSAKDTKENTEQLILAYKEARGDSFISQLLLIPCVILDFLCIRQFNGVLEREAPTSN